jgi:alpha-mannosidase
VDLDVAESVAVTEQGDALRIERRFGDSRIVQHVRLPATGRELRLVTEVDWHERQKLLKLAFPLDVHADRFASEIQFGHLERPTHANTSWDAARFETSAHRWIRAGEPDFGVAITNDSVYGFDVTRVPRAGGGAATLARLSILRAATFPDPLQDQGLHRFEIGVLAGASTEDAVIAGYRMNLAPRVVPGAADGAVRPLLAVSAPGVVVEAVKLAEDGSGDLVVRLYEALGRREQAEVRFDVPVTSVVETDLLERPLAGATAIEGRIADGVRLRLRPFQIVTLRAAR